MKSVGVIGAGSWGSALSIAFSAIAPVTLWSRDQGQVLKINQERINPGYLSGLIKFPSNIVAVSDLAEIASKDLIIIATPLMALREVLTKLKLNLPTNKNAPDLLWVCKGFELETKLLPHQIIREVLGDIQNIGALLGPSFADEVAKKLPTAITLASFELEFALKLVNQCAKIPNFRIYANNDVIGSEVGSAVKNIIAIAVGISDGLQLGFNARAALITRSLNELSNLVRKLGGKTETVYGLTGIGDLILTCTGDLSRNRKVGLELAKGLTLDEIIRDLGHVAEGVNAVKSVFTLSQQLEIDMPIVNAVYNVIYQKSDLELTVLNLLNREPKPEFISQDN